MCAADFTAELDVPKDTHSLDLLSLLQLDKFIFRR